MPDTAQVTLSGTLKTTGGTPLANQAITFTDDAGDVILSATTDANGNYSVTATVSAPHLAEKFTANFAGGGGYNASSASATADVTVGTTITINIVVS